MKIMNFRSPKLPSKAQHALSQPIAADAPVPDVQFDWNGSGLENPLDGEFEIISSKYNNTIRIENQISFNID